MADFNAHGTQEDKAPPQQASAPFDNPHADLIIRTSDLVEFHVFTVILREASPIFADMVSLPQPDAESRTASAGTVEVAEDSVVWDLLLRICYTCEFSIPGEHMWPLLEVAKKYDMIGVRDIARRRLLDAALILQDNLRSYLLACHYGFSEIAHIAARNSLSHPASDDQFIPELRCVTSATYFRWVQYRRECVKAATSFAQNHNIFYHHSAWMDRVSGWGFTQQNCRVCRPSAPKYITNSIHDVRRALHDFMAQTEAALRDRPHGDTVRDYNLVAALTQDACKCTTCGSFSGRNLTRFVEFYATQVDEAVDKVCCRDLSSFRLVSSESCFPG
ncbi:hypothetical protein FOMPIDRAFT_1130611 [Fomitopsis schrenkii]|uniref:BTB domain-containing protein n=1 Tax=Fomitopsis schrenkii TaxID=2126942 RepID=S8DUS5_FOMSC|nr:hypothetical protein FOMPIDRAFT_1130611 [Fomitopsis schrenkii]